LYEGVSNAILEALSLGIPVIATNCPSGIGEVIVDGKNGFLVSVNQGIVKNLSEKILAMSDENHILDSQETSKAIKGYFDIEIVAKEYETIFQ
jgi:glycosyltransferase involved in cell wall biosynthesis